MTRPSKTLRIVFIAAIVFLIVLSLLTYLRLTSLIELGQLVNRTTQLTLELEKTLGSFKDAETGYRGYLLSRDRRFLEPFYSGLQEYPIHLEKIKQYTADLPGQKQSLVALESLIARHQADMQQKIEPGYSAVISSDDLEHGKSIMDSIRSVVNQMIDTGNTSLDQRGQMLQKNMLLAPAMILLLSLLAFLILVLSYWQLNKTMNRSRMLQDAVLNQNVQLEKKKELQNIFDQAPVPMVVLRGSDFTFEFINGEALKVLGQPQQAVLNRPLFEITPQLKPLMEPIFKQILETGNLFRAEEFPLQFIHDGQPYNGYFDLICQPARDETGKLTGIIAIGAEVTESVIARNQIKQSEERYRDLSQSLEEKVMARTSELIKEKEFSETIIDTTLDLIAVYDTGLRILVLNKALEDLFHLKREEFTGKVFTDVFPTALNTQGHLDILRGLSGETIHNTRYHSPVTNRYYENFISPLKDDQGRVYAVLVIAHDITDIVESTKKLNQANKELLERNQFVEALINSSPDQIMVIDLEFRLITVNKKAVLDLQTLFPENPVGRLFTEIYPPDESAQLREGLAHAFKGNLLITDKINSSRSEQYFKDTYIPLLNLDQEVHAVMVIRQDVSATVRNEEALKEGEEKFNKLFQFSPFSIALSEIHSGKFVDVNENFLRTFGFSREEMIGRTSLELDIIGKETRQKILAELLDKGAVKNVEAELRTRSGEKIPVLLSIETIAIGSKKYHLNAVIDIIERKNAEFKIAQKNSELEKMNKELQSFAYISSHDLQEPLRKIQTFATRILEKEYDNLSDLVKDNFNRMRVAARRMQLLIDDLLTYSRASTEARKFEYADLQNILEEVKEDLKEEIKSRRASLEINSSPGTLFIIPFQFRQMMINLIGNSLKFSHPDRLPRIIIKTAMDKGSRLDPGLPAPEITYCHISITDNGIGFEPEYENKIFEVFQRLHDKNTYEGTGVGLAIVKKIVENHRGKIKATGVLNQGAVFDIYIPAFEPGRDS